MSKAFSLPRHVLAGSGVSRPESDLLRSIVMASPANAQLDPEPIPQEWILDGTPVARSKRLARSQDWTSSLVVWECTPGRFRWHYGQDEAMFVVSGEAFLRLENGDERRFGAGDVGFFPAGMTCDWRVSEQIRKVAVLKETVGLPLGFCLKAWKKLLRVVGLAGSSLVSRARKS
jgi:uncharacterized cupin superfamily protein